MKWRSFGLFLLGLLLVISLILVVRLWSPATPVTLHMLARPLFIGEYAKVAVSINASIGPAFDDLEFVVVEGPPGGLVSMSRDDDFDPLRPDVMLLAGYLPGKYHLEAREKQAGAPHIWARGEFTITDLWTDTKRGPSLWVEGPIEAAWPSQKAWGGGPNQPQNMDVHPASGTRHLAVVILDTKTERFAQGDGAKAKKKWKEIAIDGVTSGSLKLSSKAYFEEVAYGAGKFSLSADIAGPYQLSQKFDEYLKIWVDDKAGKLDCYETNGTSAQTCATAADAGIDFKKADSLVCVTKSVTGQTPRLMHWPEGWAATIKSKETPGGKKVNVVGMPINWESFDPKGRSGPDTLTHELGHNLGLVDQYFKSEYAAKYKSRVVDAWDLMGFEKGLPHLTIAERMMLGWVRPNQIKLYNVAYMNREFTETVTLHPIDKGSPPAARYLGVEIRRSEGWNYYCEYRHRSANQIGNRSLPTNDRVFCTDVMSKPTDRPEILKLPALGAGPVLGQGAKYQETDSSDSNIKLTIEVTKIVTGDRAELKIEKKGPVGRPDLYIRPWPAGPGRRWQSPDIEVKNERSKADKKWFNVPWVGHKNTIVATVGNSGPETAKDVEVVFYEAKSFVGKPKTRKKLGSRKGTVPKFGKKTFEAPWAPTEMPGKNWHYCIEVEIPHYKGMTPANEKIEDLTDSNNKAQSNYSRLISKQGSPPSRRIMWVEVANPFSEPARVYVDVAQSEFEYRTYVENTFLQLDGGQTETVKVMFEGTRVDDLLSGDDLVLPGVNKVSIEGLALDPRTGPTQPRNVRSIGGVGAEVATGVATTFDAEAFGVDQGGDAVYVDGKVRVAAGSQAGQGVKGGSVVVMFRQKGRGPEDAEYRAAPVAADGTFSASWGDIAIPWDTVWAYYVPAPGYADCEINKRMP